MPTTSLLVRYIGLHDKCVANDTDKTPIYSPLAFKHLSHYSTKVHNMSVSSVCSQEVTACFTSASVADRLPTECTSV